MSRDVPITVLSATPSADDSGGGQRFSGINGARCRQFLDEVIWRKVLLGQMANGEHQDHVLANREHGSMSAPPTDAEIQIANLIRKVVVLSGDGAAIGMLGQGFDRVRKRVVPLGRLSLRPMLSPPGICGFHFDVSPIRQHHGVGHTLSGMLCF